MNICKPPEPLSFTGNNAKNWQDFKEQLQWFLAGTESTEKSDAVKIGIMLSHAGREARELFRGLQRATTRNLIKFWKRLKDFVPRNRIFFTNDMGFGPYNKMMTNQ